MDETSSFQEHKLYGYLCIVLIVNSSHSDLAQALPFSTPCQIFNDGSKTCFIFENSVVLSPVGVKPLKNDCASVEDSGAGSRRRLRRMGLVNGSMSVVHQLQSLVNQKCLKIDARLMHVEVGENEEARALVLVDVYLQIAVWSGWQFPKSSSVAGAMFRHLRYIVERLSFRAEINDSCSTFISV